MLVAAAARVHHERAYSPRETRGRWARAGASERAEEVLQDQDAGSAASNTFIHSKFDLYL